jgi:hypothetical protein
MKFLALERPVPGATAATMRPLLRAEAARAWELLRGGILREAYFTPAHDAVLILECADEPAARDALASLPLVREGQLRFELHALQPYTGFERLFAPSASGLG